MGLFTRSFAAVAVVFATAISIWIAESATKGGPELSRAFVPGSLGREPGRTASPSDPRGFRTRYLYGFERREEKEWTRNNGLTEPVAFSHNLLNVFPPVLFEEHPEFFPLEAGKRVRPPQNSYYWNPDIARPDVATFAAQAARRHFQTQPKTEFFSLGANDGVEWGESPELLALTTPVKWFRGRPDYSALVFTFLNRAAEELSRTHPDKYIGALAYDWTENIPPFPPHRQVVPFLTADRTQGYDPEFWRQELALMSKWGALAGERAPDAVGRPPRRLGLYDYLYGAGFLIPRIHTRLLAEHLRHARQAGFTDYFAEMQPNWGLDGPMPWLVAQLVRDPSQSRDALLSEFYTRYFREAATPMRSFFERCEELWMAQPPPAYWLKLYRNESQATLFPPAACAELRTLLRTAERAVATATTRPRVALVSAAFGITERLSLLHVARDELARAILNSASSNAINVALREYIARREEFVNYGTRLRKLEPLALHPFNWNDYLRNDPTAAAILALLGAGQRKMPISDGIEARALWFSLSPSASLWRERLSNATLEGPMQTERTVAGIAYGVELPPSWQSRVEPAERHRATLSPSPNGRVVRIEGTTNTRVSQYVTLIDRWVHRAQVEVRGRLSPSASVSLVVEFMDASNRQFAVKSMRLPVGEWPDWVTLRQAALPPSNATLIGFLLRVQNQAPGDWVEARNFSLATPVNP